MMDDKAEIYIGERVRREEICVSADECDEGVIFLSAFAEPGSITVADRGKELLITEYGEQISPRNTTEIVAGIKYPEMAEDDELVISYAPYGKIEIGTCFAFSVTYQFNELRERRDGLSLSMEHLELEEGFYNYFEDRKCIPMLILKQPDKLGLYFISDFCIRTISQTYEIKKAPVVEISGTRDYFCKAERQA